MPGVTSLTRADSPFRLEPSLIPHNNKTFLEFKIFISLTPFEWWATLPLLIWRAFRILRAAGLLRTHCSCTSQSPSAIAIRMANFSERERESAQLKCTLIHSVWLVVSMVSMCVRSSDDHLAFMQGARWTPFFGLTCLLFVTSAPRRVYICKNCATAKL